MILLLLLLSWIRFEKLFHSALYSANITEIKELILNDFYMGTVYDEERLAFQIAVELNKPSKIKKLFESGAYVKDVEIHLKKLIHPNSVKDWNNMSTLILQFGIDLEENDAYILNQTVQENENNSLKKFTHNDDVYEESISDVGPNLYRKVRASMINNESSECTTNLKSTIGNCSLSAVKSLINHCGSVNDNLGYGYSFLHVAVSSVYSLNLSGYFPNMTKCNLGLMKVFIEEGADVNAQSDENHNRSTPLHLAAKFDSLKAAQILLENKANMELRDKLFRTPLYVCSEYGSQNVLRLLIKYKANVNANEMTRNWFPIHVATQFGRIEAIEILLNSGANIEQKSSWYERRPLHQAVRHNQTKTLEFLINKGAEVNATDLWLRSGLHIAAEYGFAEITKILIQAKANIDERMRERRTPLCVAAACGHVTVVSLLLENGADVKHRTIDGRTVLHYASTGGNLDVVKVILQEFPEAIHIRDGEGKTPIHSAALGGATEVVNELITQGADPHTITNNKKTILHYTAQSGDEISTLSIISKFKVDINAKDFEGKTALFLAATYGSIEVFFVLLEKGANPCILNNMNETLLHGAAKSGNEIIIKAVLNISKSFMNARDSRGITPMFTAAMNGRNAAFEMLFDLGADPDIASNDGDTFLHWAAHFGKETTIEKILNKSINIEVVDKKLRTPLYIAAEEGQEKVFFLLEKKGANIKMSTIDGRKLLHGASLGGNIKICKFVLKKVGDIDVQDNSGRTPLYIAASKPWEHLFIFFLENGANYLEKTYDRRTILHAAAAGGNADITRIILKKTKLLNERDIYGKPALFYAAERTKHYIFNLLMNEGADVSPTIAGWTLLHSACKARDLTIINRAIYISGNINVQDEEGKTPLYVAVEYYQRSTFNYLISKKADPDISKRDGGTIMHWASHYGDEYFARGVLKVSKKSINKQDAGGRTPLHWAVYHNRLEVAQLLLENNANTNVETIYGYTPLAFAAAFGSVEMMDLFKSHDYNAEALVGMALAWNNREVISYLFRTKVTPTEKSKVHFAAARGDNVELQKLLSQNVNMKAMRFGDIMSEIMKEYKKFTVSMEEDDVQIINPLGFSLSPLDMAVFFNGTLETVQIILNSTNLRTGDLMRNRRRWNPLDMAAYSGKEEIVKFCLKMNLTNNFMGEDLWSPMHKAAWGGHSPIIKLLYENNFDINMKGILGRTPLHTAVMRGYSAVVEEILNLDNSSLDQQDRYVIKRFSRTLFQ